MMATPAPSFTNQDEHVAWIRAFAQSTYGIDITEVRPLFIPGYTGGGGGLYMKASELGYDVKLQGAKDALGKRSAEAAGFERGKVVFVRELAPKSDPMEALTCCWILWHEMGHAVGDRAVPKNVGEPYAYKFEFRAILSAYNTGRLAQWGFSRELLKDFFEARKKNKPDSAEMQALAAALG